MVEKYKQSPQLWLGATVSGCHLTSRKGKLGLSQCIEPWCEEESWACVAAQTALLQPRRGILSSSCLRCLSFPICPLPRCRPDGTSHMAPGTLVREAGDKCTESMQQLSRWKMDSALSGCGEGHMRPDSSALTAALDVPPHDDFAGCLHQGCSVGWGSETLN